LGEFLVGTNGMTLYLFTRDEPGISNCSDGCAAAWPPLLVADGETPTAGSSISGQLGVTERDDGTLQVTYNDLPLYYWASDSAPGDATGHGVNDVWYVVDPSLESFLEELTADTIMLGGNDELGEFLVGANGMTLYLFTRDEPGISNCYDGCAAAWPPLLVADGEIPTVGEGATGELGVIEREDGTLQVTYNALPLYYWASDVEPGDATGHGVNDVWYVVDPSLASILEELAADTIMLGGNDELGEFLVGANGMTLYLFTRDEPGVSNCSDGCAAAWPPLLVADGETPIAGEGATGELGVIERDDGTLQVTYNDLPLYYWASDVEPGDATGHGVNDVWFVVEP
jgi:predicted lipoprotein with Yx(FWY)xxD motif